MSAQLFSWMLVFAGLGLMILVGSLSYELYCKACDLHSRYLHKKHIRSLRGAMKRLPLNRYHV